MSTYNLESVKLKDKFGRGMNVWDLMDFIRFYDILNRVYVVFTEIFNSDTYNEFTTEWEFLYDDLTDHDVLKIDFHCDQSGAIYTILKTEKCNKWVFGGEQLRLI